MAMITLSAADARRLGVAPAGFAKAQKFNATRTQVDGVWYDSAREARRGAALRVLERAGVIRDLERQIEYPILVAVFAPDGEVIGLAHIASWFADFRYRTAAGVSVVEDTKGTRETKGKGKRGTKTRMYLLKKKAVEAQYGIRIVES